MTGHLDIVFLVPFCLQATAVPSCLCMLLVMQCSRLKFIEINPIKLPFQTLQLTTNKENKKAIPLTSLGGLYGCEMLRIPHCLDNRLTVNCETLATCSSTYSPGRTLQEAHSVSIR
jgi:hypothetical protein